MRGSGRVEELVGVSEVNTRVKAMGAQPLCTHKHTDTWVRDSGCVSDATDRCYCLVPAVPYLSPQVSGAAAGVLMTHTHARTHSFTHPLLQLSHR